MSSSGPGRAECSLPVLVNGSWVLVREAESTSAVSGLCCLAGDCFDGCWVVHLLRSVATLHLRLPSMPLPLRFLVVFSEASADLDRIASQLRFCSSIFESLVIELFDSVLLMVVLARERPLDRRGSRGRRVG